LPATVIVPGAPNGPGTRKPPALICVFPIVPAPLSSPPPFTVVSAEEAIEPSTIRAPPLIVVGPA